MDTRYIFDVRSEWCCESCQQVEHNHFDCPVCGKKYAPSDRYCDLDRDWMEYDNGVIGCEACGARFRLLSDSAYLDAEWELLAEVGERRV